MKLNSLLFILGGLLFLGFPNEIFCDYTNLLKCGLQKDCWPHLNEEVVNAINENIQNTSNPCENFWNYACGNWKSPTAVHYTDNFGYAMDNYVHRLRGLLTQSVQNNFDENGIENLMNKLRNYFESCVGLKSNHSDFEPYLSELKQAHSEYWPNWQSIIESKTWNQNANFNWLKIVAELRQYGLNGIIIEEHATVAFNDSTKAVFELKMPDEDQNFENAFQLVYYFVHFGFIEGYTDEIWNLAVQILELETQLKELRMKHSLDDDATYEEALNLCRLKERIPNIDWQNYFNILLEQDYVSCELSIEVNGIGYFREVTALLDQTNDKVLALYILMHLCKYIAEMQVQMDSKHCIDHMGTLMPLGLNYIYDRFLYETRKNDEMALQNIFEKLKKEFQKYINSNKLRLNEAEQSYIKEKLDKMKLRIGNLPEHNMPSEYYNHYYDNVNVNENFYQNHLRTLHFRTQQQHFALRHKQKHIDMHKIEVYDDLTQMRNAPYFIPERNLIIVPMIFMQLPFFHDHFHALFQHSIVGFILGHEFNHAFGSEGIIVDAYGNESPMGFSIKLKKEFQSNVKCFQKNKSSSLEERMADVNGFQLVYDAYFGNFNENIMKNGVNASNFLREFTERQLFFLNFAQFFCGKIPKAIGHDGDNVRVNEIVENIHDFREIFHCNNADRHEICEMWRN